ncbi:MAG: hypothetical protein MUQ25_12590 [Candidatus Aminicenantes bacterium]|nr:hypothetical protein [Candidatus Aminicenantes bacterium]
MKNKTERTRTVQLAKDVRSHYLEFEDLKELEHLEKVEIGSHTLKIYESLDAMGKFKAKMRTGSGRLSAWHPRVVLFAPMFEHPKQHIGLWAFLFIISSGLAEVDTFVEIVEAAPYSFGLMSEEEFKEYEFALEALALKATGESEEKIAELLGRKTRKGIQGPINKLTEKIKSFRFPDVKIELKIVNYAYVWLARDDTREVVRHNADAYAVRLLEIAEQELKKAEADYDAFNKKHGLK